MKKKWYSAVQIISLPIVMLMVGFGLTALGRLKPTNDLISTIVSCAVYFGNLLISLFPLALLINYTGSKYEDAAVVMVSIACYLVLNVVTMFINDGHFPSYFYGNSLGLSYSYASGASTIVKEPLNIGLFGSLIVGVIILFTYKLSRKRYNYGIFSFINNDAWFLILAIGLTIVTAIGINFAYPLAFKSVRKVLRFIATNNTNPASLFIYGIVDKLCGVAGIHNIIEEGIWLGELGGSWIYNDVLYVGDLNIWTAQIANGVLASGTGKFISGYYVNNIFVIPSLLAGILLHTSDKVERNKLSGICLAAVIVSVICGSALPVEIVLLFISPLLFGFHLLMSGAISMFLCMNNFYLGAVISDVVTCGNVGNIIDFLHYLYELNTNSVASGIVFTGIVSFAIYQVAIDFYYRFLSRHFLEGDKAKAEVKQIIIDLGGYNNISMVTSTPNKVVVVLKNKEAINTEGLLQSGVYHVVERYFGYYLEYGPGSYALGRALKKEIKQYESLLKYHMGA